MQAPEALRNVAVPTDGPMRGQGLLEIFQRNFVPLQSLLVFVDEGGRMIMPMDFAKRLVAVDALLSFIPAIDNDGNQAILWRLLNLRQALLAAAGHFRPARAFAQLKMRPSYQRFDGRPSRGHPDTGWLVIFRAGDDAFAAKLSVNTQRTEKLKNDNREDDRENQKDVWHNLPLADQRLIDA